MFAYCGNNPVNRFDPTGQFAGLLPLFMGIVKTIATVVISAIVAVAVKNLVVGVIVAVQEYRNRNVMYSNSASDNTSNPISDAMEKRIPNSELNPPKARGKKPTSKKDDKPIEIHHKGQNPTGPFEELTRTDHRLGENYLRNHPNFREKSKIDRDQFVKDVNKYWKREWDSGRWRE